jgi:rubrerythrin
MKGKRFLREVKSSAKEESGAVKHYRKMATESRQMGDKKTASILSGIARQESRHQKKLQKIAKRR